MSKYRKLTYVYYKCDYHIVFTPKYRFQILEGMVKSLVEHDLQLTSSWKDVEVIELNWMSKKTTFIWYVWFLQRFQYPCIWDIEREDGNQAFQNLSKFKTETILGNHFWARGYFVSTVGLDEAMIRRYVKYQEHHD